MLPPNNAANTQTVIKSDSVEQLKYTFKKDVVQIDIIAYTHYFMRLLPESAIEQ